MAINFPNSPLDGNTYTFNDVTYVYVKNGTDVGYWRVALPKVSGVATAAEIDAGVNAVKYISRHKRKNGKEDILKAIWYLERIIEIEYGDDK